MKIPFLVLLLIISTCFCKQKVVAIEEDIEDQFDEEDNDVNETVKEVTPPTMYFIEPYPREGFEFANTSISPCAGLPKGKTHLLITPGSYSNVQWKIAKGVEEGLCQVRLYYGVSNESAYVVLYPEDNSGNSEGKFGCGRYSNTYETKEFFFPVNLSCDSCTLQLTWETIEFKNYYCTDITIMSDEIKYCLGRCLNGGVCVNGHCICEDSYYGEFCEKKHKITISVGKMWIFYIIMAIIIGIFAYLVYRSAKSKTRDTQPMTKEGDNRNIRDLSNLMGENNKDESDFKKNKGKSQTGQEPPWKSETPFLELKEDEEEDKKMIGNGSEYEYENQNQDYNQDQNQNQNQDQDQDQNQNPYQNQNESDKKSNSGISPGYINEEDQDNYNNDNQPQVSDKVSDNKQYSDKDKTSQYKPNDKESSFKKEDDNKNDDVTPGGDFAELKEDEKQDNEPEGEDSKRSQEEKKDENDETPYNQGNNGQGNTPDNKSEDFNDLKEHIANDAFEDQDD